MVPSLATLRIVPLSATYKFPLESKAIPAGCSSGVLRALVGEEMGALDDVPTPRVGEFESGFGTFLERERGAILTSIAKENAVSDESAKGLDEAVDAFRKGFLA